METKDFTVDGSSGYSIKDSGVREEMNTGAHRDSRAGKGRFDLLWPFAILDLAIHMEKGAIKYDERNWEKGIKMSRLLDSGLRHLFSYMAGNTDEEHLISAVWNFMCMLDTRTRVAKGLLPEELADFPPDSVEKRSHLFEPEDISSTYRKNYLKVYGHKCYCEGGKDVCT